MVLWAAGSLQPGEIKRGFLQTGEKKIQVKKEGGKTQGELVPLMSLGEQRETEVRLELA